MLVNVDEFLRVRVRAAGAGKDAQRLAPADGGPVRWSTHGVCLRVGGELGTTCGAGIWEAQDVVDGGQRAEACSRRPAERLSPALTPTVAV